MYIPVGTRLEYTASYRRYTRGVFVGTSWTELSSLLRNDLPNLPGMEDLEVEGSNGSTAILPLPSNNETISLRILNNGVDHGDENDVKSIIDGTIQSYGIELVNSNITKITLPGESTVNTGADPNAPSTTSKKDDMPFSLASFVHDLIFGKGTTGTGTKIFTSGTIIITVVIALVLLLPGGALKLIKGVTR